MPTSRKRRPSNYQLVQARNRKNKVRDKNAEAVRKIYDAAMPEKQEYPPTLRGESKPTAKPYNKARENARRARQLDARIDDYYRRAA